MSVAGEHPERDELLVAEYALGVLPHAERQAFTERLAREPALRARLAAWEAHFIPLAQAYEEATPPPHTLPAIESRLFGTEQSASGRWFTSLAFWRGLSIASLAGMVLFAGLYTSTILREGLPESRLVAELQGESNVVRVVAVFDPARSTLKVNRAEGDAIAGRDLELWLIPPGQAPISLGVLPRERVTVKNVPEALTGAFDGALLAISDEPEGGSPTGQPTGAVVASGKVTEI